MSDIRNQLLCIDFSISCWEGRKQDKKATKETEEKHQTAKGVARTNKDLLPGAEEHQAVLSIRDAWRVWHTNNTLPWTKGVGVIKSAAYFDYSAGYREWRERFEAACEVFFDAYPALVTKAQFPLNTLFDPQDYPDVRDLTRRFSSRMRVSPMPDADDFRIIEGIDAVEAEELRQSAIDGLQTQVTEALKDLWGQMHKVVTSMQTRLDIPHGQPGGKFHDTLVGNIEELLVRVPKLNLTNDPEIARMTEEMQELLVAPDALRNDPDLRQDKANQARALAARMKQYVGD